jgi:hypothetical protein
MNLKKGQRVRVFGILKDSWVLGEVRDIGVQSVTVRISDWVGIPDSLYTVGYDSLEVICDNLILL